MEHENHIIELFVGYSIFTDTKRQEMKANCSVTLIKGKNKIVLVRKTNSLEDKIFFVFIDFMNE